MSKKITYISIPSVLKIVPIIFFLIFLVISVFISIYLFFFNNLGVGIIDFFLASIVYSLISTLIVSCISVLFIYLYNVLAEKIGYIEIDYKDNE